MKATIITVNRNWLKVSVRYMITGDESERVLSFEKEVTTEEIQERIKEVLVQHIEVQNKVDELQTLNNLDITI